MRRIGTNAPTPHRVAEERRGVAVADADDAGGGWKGDERGAGSFTRLERAENQQRIENANSFHSPISIPLYSTHVHDIAQPL